MNRSGLLLGGLAAANAFVSVASQIIIIRAIGTSPETDAYVAAIGIPLVLYAVLAAALQGVWLPRLVVADDVGWHLTLQRATGQASLWFGLTCLAVALAAPVLVGLLFPGIRPDLQPLAARITQITMLGTFCNGLLAMLVVAGRSRERFVVVELLPFLATVAALALTFPVVTRFGLVGAAWLFTARLAVGLSAVWLVIGAHRPVIAYSTETRTTGTSARALLLGTSVYKLGPLVDRYWVVQSPPGTLTVFNLTSAAISALTLVMERFFATPVIPSLSRALKAGDIAHFRSLCRRSGLQALGFTLVVMAACLVLAPLLADMLVLLLKITPDQAKLMVWLGVLLLGAAFVGAAGSTYASAFYAMGDTATPIRIGLAGFLVGLVLKALGYLAYGVLGLAAGTSAYFLLNAAMFGILLERRLAAMEAGSNGSTGQ